MPGTEIEAGGAQPEDRDEELASLSPVPASREIGEQARSMGQFPVEREERVAHIEHVVPRPDGSLLIGELSDMLLIMPGTDLSSTMNSDRFREDLLRHAGKKPYIVIELNQQGFLPTDKIVWPLVDFCKACGDESRVFVATRDESSRRRFDRMTMGEVWTNVDSGRDAIRQIDLERFLEQRERD